ncbi:ABC transporter ATP-binding protein [Peribacillus saganii]|uniref:ABC transporter ATP-binding protein n=1 Tax=Peribacillus saganii TaxID=2303992 RepID=A0A372LSF4_9BACI|nr:ABC transporter ATP-binding protein [Peribacillus saganii]RFU70484.1 ABC transporter ATP-binding protein [Peribacillus saganii]
MSYLEIAGVISGYGKIPILHEVSLHVNQGEMVAVIGSNGAGKTTLMHTIAGLLPLMKGSISFQGKRIDTKSASDIARMGLGYVPQRKNVFAELTVLENLEMGAYTLKNPKDQIKEMLELFPRLKERIGQRAGTLSGGERQMLALSSALIVKPKLLLLDEPITGLAPQIIKGLIELIVEIRNQGTTIVWVVEENPKDVLQHADRVYLMDSGIIKMERSGREFLEEENFEELFLGH